MPPMVWKVVIRPRPDAPDVRQGYVRAESEDEALVLVNSQFAVLWTCPGKLWPGSPNSSLCWSN